jgi:hypothetical protein
VNTDETYNGWANRETWAAALWINNDQGLQSYVLESISEQIDGCGSDDPSDRATYAGEIVRNLFDEWAAQLTDEPDTMTRDMRMMLLDIGSAYRIDFDELGATFLTTLAES